MPAAQTRPPAAAPAAVQPPLFHAPPPAARPLRLLRPGADVAALEPGAAAPRRAFDRTRNRADGSTAAARIERAPDGSPAAWRIRVAVTSAADARPFVATRQLYAPTYAAAAAALEAIMQALDAAQEAAAVRPDVEPLRLVRPGDDVAALEPVAWPPPGVAGDPTRAAG